MGKINISENLFLEKAELVRMQRFNNELGWQRAIRGIISQFGIVENSNETSFKVVKHPSESNSVLIYPGLAYTPSMEAIVLNEERSLSVGSGTDRRWIILSHDITHEEEGTVSIQQDGSLVGVGTKFTEVLRGQPNFPVKIRFTNSANNVYEYEVVSVISDTNAILSGEFIAQSGLKYSVVGSFTPGFVPSDENKNIYSYDSCAFSVVIDDAKPEVSDDQFVIAQIDYDGGTMVVSDLRSECMLVLSGTGSSDSKKIDYGDGTNPCVSLRALTRVGGDAWKNSYAELELIVEFAYFVNSYDITSGAELTFNIVSGFCNAISAESPSAIPNGTFNNFILLNRSNMKWVRIISQTGAQLKLANTNLSILLGEDQDFIIVPYFSHIEICATADGAVVMPEVPFTFDGEISEGRGRMVIRLKYPYEDESAPEEVEIKLQYRMYSSERSGILKLFNTATYIDGLQGVSLTSAGTVTVNLADIQPVPLETERNYS